MGDFPASVNSILLSVCKVWQYTVKMGRKCSGPLGMGRNKCVPAIHVTTRAAAAAQWWWRRRRGRTGEVACCAASYRRELWEYHRASSRRYTGYLLPNFPGRFDRARHGRNAEARHVYLEML
uniref:Uncharacterized protein n=1 Tax=Setaria italica TaxID=4555 RepID=K3YAV9_SETIT